jgi:hypothetical protein
MKLVKLYGTNTQGIPAEWVEIVKVKESGKPVPAGYIEMTDAALTAYLAEKKPLYDAWANSQPQTNETKIERVYAYLQGLPMADRGDFREEIPAFFSAIRDNQEREAAYILGKKNLSSKVTYIKTAIAAILA